MRSLSRRSALVAILACIPAFFAPPSAAQSRAPILIGAVLTLTGSSSVPGLSTAASLDAVVRHVNAKGGIAGRPLEVRILDDGGNADHAVEELKRLANEADVIAVVGATQRSTAAALEQAANEAQIPFLSLAPRQAGGEPVLPWVFRLAVPEPVRIGLLIDYAKRHSLSRLAVLFSNDEYGQNAAKIGSQLATSAGLTIVNSEPLPAGNKVDDAYVLRAKANGTQSFLAFVSERRPIVLAKAMAVRTPGLSALSDVPAATADFLRAAGKEANYWRIASPKVAVAQLVPASDPLHAAIVDFVSLYPPSVRPDAISGSAHDALMMVIDATRSAGPDRAKIRAALESGKEFVGAMGVYSMSPSDHGAVDSQGLTLIEGSSGTWKKAD
ncbi:MAG TPA: ABC transporter substrate-binding protein [Candidatus Binatia bacterium]|nr:ABC transporter substrate-binding protein [Candidatus Binatia bacterium]